MSFHLEEAKSDDFPKLIQCLWESYEEPHQQFFRLYCPIIGTGPTAREDSLQDSTQRMLSLHLEDSTSYWQKVVDEANDTIIGGALWKICEKNSFEYGFHAEEATWWLEGGERDFVIATIRKHDVARSYVGYYAQRPQICMFFPIFRALFASHVTPSCARTPPSRLDSSSPESACPAQIYVSKFTQRPAIPNRIDLNIIFVHPSYRRQGVGLMLTQWGMQKADAMGVELWLDASIHGKPLYESQGFEVVLKDVLKVENSAANEDWKRLDKEMNLDPMTMWVMWRPVKGLFERDGNGRIVRP